MLNKILKTFIEQRQYCTEDRSWWQAAVVGLDLQNQMSQTPWPPNFSYDEKLSCSECKTVMCDHSWDWLWICHRCDVSIERTVMTIGHVGKTPLLIMKDHRGESALVITIPLERI